jgi:prepilin-type N-terminal cleavage/methylation domain-containing protein
MSQPAPTLESRMSPGQAAAWTRAFTLTELVAVLAIIAVGALMLAPALARTSPSVKRWQCINNLQHWSQAMRLYAGDNSDTVPSDGMSASGIYPGGAGGGHANSNAWYNLLPQFLGERTLNDYWNDPGSPVDRLPFPGGKGKVWHCPSAYMSSADLANLAGGGAEGFFSYAFNIDLKKATATVNMTYPQMPRTAAFRKPAATVLMTDAVFSSDEGLSVGNNFYSVNPAGRWRVFPTRHNKEAGVLAFCDGHAAYFKRAKITAEQIGYEPLLPDVIWNPPYRLANP